MGIIESMARMPVCMGSCTGLREMTPGALNSTGRMPSALMGPLPSIGMPSGLTTRPSISRPDGTSTIRPVVRNLVVLLDCRDVTQEHGAHFVFLEVLGQAVDGLAALPREFQKLAGHGVLQAVDARNAVADLDDGADLARLDARVQGVKLLAQRFVDRLCGDFSH